MKTNLIKTIAAALLLLVVVNGYSSNDDPKVIKERLENVRTQITDYIDNPNLTGIDIKEMEATLHFVINKESELVVVYVDSENVFVDSFLKERLNYKKIKDNLLRGPYSMKITIKNGSLL
ncbi:MAG: hypothetical protein KDC80_01270 [Saprospiraceae bacterium]|nr:hypothetical protein [Saprospiraceae bacterium]